MAQANIDISFIPTQRGGRRLVKNGYTHWLNRRHADGLMSWRCATQGCSATLSTRNDLVSHIGRDHNHAPNSCTVAVANVMERIKKQAFDEITPMPSIYRDEIANLRTDEVHLNDGEIARQMPTFDAVKDSLYRRRRKNTPALPAQRSDILLEGEWSRTTSGENFLLINDGDDDKIIVFSTTANLQNIANATTVYGDGTFFAAPRLFHQIYTFHAFVDNQMFPLVFCFLPDKSQHTYTRLFHLLCHAMTERNIIFNPHSFQMNYELAAHNAVRDVFPNSEIRGCFFHYTQCIWRQVQKLGLQTVYQDVVNRELYKFVRRISVLPLVPVDRIDDVCIETIAEAPNTTAATQLADYATNTWMAGTFPPAMWNHHDNDGPRTTNHLKGWHRKLNSTVMKAHPNIFEILFVLKKEPAANEVKKAQLEGGAPPPKRRAMYRKIDE